MSCNRKRINYLDLFSGAGGLSEGFIREGYIPLAHVEMNKAACNTLKTRAAYHYLEKNDDLEFYKLYTSGKISRDEFYSKIPAEVLNSIICEKISKKSINSLFAHIDEILKNRTVDLIVGGPPCQAYSLVGRAKSPDKMVNDERNHLYIYYAQFLQRYKPKYFVFENVLGLLSAKDKNGNKYFDLIQEKFKKCGYTLKYKVLSANDYGVLQNRKRIILIGKKTDKDFIYPEPEKCKIPTAVNAVFLDLPKIHAGEGDVFNCPLSKEYDAWLDMAKIRNDTLPVTFHCARPNTPYDLAIYKIAVTLWNEKKERLNYNDLPDYLKHHSNISSFLDRFKIVAGDATASQTIVAHIAKDGHYYIHPDIEQNRSITPREAARLQSFPDDYYFESVSGKPSRTEAFKQIGNAVPVLLAQKIAAKLKESWE